MAEVGQAAERAAHRGLLVNGLASLVLTLAGYGSAWLGYQDYAPPLNRLVWGSFSVLLFIYWLVLLILAATVRRPSRIPGWHHTRMILEFGTFAGVMGVTFLFMPWGSTELQHVTLLFSTSYCAATILSSADGHAFTRWRIAAVMGGLALVCVLERLPLWPFLTAYLLILGTVLIVFDALVRRTIASMRNARADAEASRDVRTRFVAAAAHDLGQPLQAARLFFEQAIRAPTAEARSAAAAHTRAAFAGMEDLVEAMLDHLRLSAGAAPAARAALPLEPVIAACVDRYAVTAEAAGVQLVALPTGAVAEANAALVHRVLGNFIDNALRHADARRILVGARRRGASTVRLFVADDGAGLGDQDTERLFDDYAQGDQGAGPARGGFGIGLASARRAGAAMGGIAGHDPSWTSGALFFLDLPAQAPHTRRDGDTGR